MERKRAFIITVLMALAVMFTQAQEVKVPLRFDFYYTYEKMNEALKALNIAYPDFTKVEEVGRSEEESHHGADNQQPENG